MTKYNTSNIKLSNSQINKLKSEIRTGTEVTLNLSSNVISDSNDETNFPHKLLLNHTQVLRIRKAFANGSSANIKFSKSQLSKMIQSGGLLIPDPLGTFASFPPFNMIDSIVNSYKKELKNTDPKKLNNNLFVDRRLNIIG